MRTVLTAIVSMALSLSTIQTPAQAPIQEDAVPAEVLLTAKSLGEATMRICAMVKQDPKRTPSEVCVLAFTVAKVGYLRGVFQRYLSRPNTTACEDAQEYVKDAIYVSCGIVVIQKEDPQTESATKAIETYCKAVAKEAYTKAESRCLPEAKSTPSEFEGTYDL